MKGNVTIHIAILQQRISSANRIYREFPCAELTDMRGNKLFHRASSTQIARARAQSLSAVKFLFIRRLSA